MQIMNLDAFKFSKSFNFDHQARSRILDDIKGDQLLKYICYTLSSPDEMELISKKSYEHGNGFIKIVLLDRLPYFSLRLHIWSGFKKDRHIHNHPWDMSGVLLKGNYSWRIYDVYREGSSFNRYNCIYTASSQGHFFYKKDCVDIKMLFESSIREGEIFFLNSSAYHDVLNCADYSASLVLHGEVKKDADIFVLSQCELAEELVSNKLLSVEQLRLLLKDFLKRVFDYEL